jgi:hypothetical protein
MTYALGAADKLAEDGIEAEVIDLRTIRPMDIATVLESVKKTNRCVTVEEAWPQCSVGSEIAAQVMDPRLRLARRAGDPRQWPRRADALCRQPRKAGAAVGRRSRRGGQGRVLRQVARLIPRRPPGALMPTPILMPALSPTMETGTLAKWLKKEGDQVQAPAM